MSSYRRGVILHWNGRRWVVVPHPAPNLAFQAVLAVSSTDVWFAGNDYGLIEHWNGKRISRVPNNVGANVQQLSGTRPSSIWALSYGDENIFLARWNGSTWLSARPPDFGGDPADGISARGTKDLWVVGGYPGAMGDVAHWDGSGWRYIRNPVFRHAGSGPDAVLDLGPRNVWIVGWHIVHFDGRSWKVTPSPSLPGLVEGTDALAGFSHGPLYAAGASGNNKALVLRWTGKRWVTARIPLPKGRSSFDALAVARDGEVSAGGDTYRGNDQHNRPFIEHYVPCART